MSAVGITENAKGDNKKFEIWCNSREEVYIVQVCGTIPKIISVNLQLHLLPGNSNRHSVHTPLIAFLHKYWTDAFQAPTAEVKTTWVNEIRKVLTTQLEACKGKMSKIQPGDMRGYICIHKHH